MRHDAEGLSDEELRQTPLETLRKWLRELQDDVTAINTSLSGGEKVDDRGQRLSYREYTNWRVSAKVALKHRLAALRRVKDAMRNGGGAEFQRQIGSLRPHARALLRELRVCDLRGEKWAAVRRTMLKLAGAAFGPEHEECGEIAGAIAGWENRATAEVP